MELIYKSLKFKIIIVLSNISLILLFNLNIIKIIKIYLNNKQIKVCLCTLGKEENKYVREYVAHYINYGVDKIFIYDNNNIDGESFDIILNDYIKNKSVTILNYRGYKKSQISTMNHCYKANYKKYNWLIFYDMDEYIYLKNYSNIKYYLNEPIFIQCKLIRLNLLYHTDNNNLYYKNKSLFERFPEINKNVKAYVIKTILKGNINGIKIVNVHYLLRNKKIKACNGFGHKLNNITVFAQEVDLKYYYINHFSFKSTEEFIDKMNRGSAVSGYNNKTIRGKIGNYFRHNLITLNKIKFIEKMTGLKLTKLREKLKNNIKYNIF